MTGSKSRLTQENHFLVNASDWKNAMYTFLVMGAFATAVFLLLRPLFGRLIAWAGNSAAKNEMLTFFTFLIVFLSALFTEAIGVHAIFGGFLGTLCMGTRLV
jgi:Kef-type K+ transport system membrane component KefB